MEADRLAAGEGEEPAGLVKLRERVVAPLGVHAEEVVVVNTHNRAAKVDGRYPHWVAPWSGERYSVIVFKTRGVATPLGPAVYAEAL